MKTMLPNLSILQVDLFLHVMGKLSNVTELYMAFTKYLYMQATAINSNSLSY